MTFSFGFTVPDINASFFVFFYTFFFIVWAISLNNSTHMSVKEAWPEKSWSIQWLMVLNLFFVWVTAWENVKKMFVLNCIMHECTILRKKSPLTANFSESLLVPSFMIFHSYQCQQLWSSLGTVVINSGKEDIYSRKILLCICLQLFAHWNDPLLL